MVYKQMEPLNVENTMVKFTTRRLLYQPLLDIIPVNYNRWFRNVGIVIIMVKVPSNTHLTLVLVNITVVIQMVLWNVGEVTLMVEVLSSGSFYYQCWISSHLWDKYAWIGRMGNNRHFQSSPPSEDLLTSVGNSHGSIKLDDTIECWGYNGSEPAFLLLVPFLHSGYQHTCIKTDN